MKIAMIASEANPLCKSGGLADVTYSLTKQINAIKGNKAIIILPFYLGIKFNEVKPTFLKWFMISMGWRTQYVGVFKLKIDNIEYYLIDNEYYFKRDNLYGYHDDCERFAYFSLAAIELLREIKFKADIVHVHDWQAGMVPCLLKHRYCFDEFFSGMKTVLTIHNPAFKGFVDKYFLSNFFGLSDELYDNGSVRFENQVSTLKSGIYYADKITTVSPTHRNELLSPDTSHGLSGVLEFRKDDFVGIINGVDTVEFNPADDKSLVKTYNVSTVKSGKKANKLDLLKFFNIEGNENTPVFGLVSRLTWQKGIDLVLSNIENIVNKGGVAIILGSGEYNLEQGFEEIKRRFPDKVGLYIGYSDRLAHKVYAGSDFFLMPSLFEPCGIGQIIAQRYGTLPIVRRTGGLNDTVIGYDGSNEDVATGFSFDWYNGLALGKTVDFVFETCKKKTVINKLVKNCLNLDRSWMTSALLYLDVYKGAKEK